MTHQITPAFSLAKHQLRSLQQDAFTLLRLLGNTSEQSNHYDEVIHEALPLAQVAMR
jgi:hypothetical protein